jgi:Flp pilus assembly protein TadG
MLGLISKLKKFRLGESGAVAPIVAVVAVPLIMAAGVAVDYGNAVSIQAKLQAAVDAAALAAGREANLTDAELRRIAEDYFHSNFGSPANTGTPSLTLSVNGDDLNVRGQVEVHNYLTKVAGFDTTLISASSEVTKEATGLEVVLVFDNTGSMGSQSRLSTLKVAAHDFVEILFGPRETADTLKIGVVPFSQFVNVGPDKSTAFWLDTEGKNAYSKKNFDNSKHNWWAWGQLRNRTWTGCVESRTGDMSVDDTLPDANNGATLFPPAFAPDEPGNSSSRSTLNGKKYYNSYLSDRKRGSDASARQKYYRKYQGKSVSTSSRGPDRGCNIQPIQELINQKSPVLNTINNMRASGYTHVAEGVGWGLRVLSPAEPFAEGVSYDDDKITKAMVLLTDGENTFNTGSSRYYNINKSSYTAYGYLGQARLGSSSYSTAITKQNQLLVKACNNVKAADIVNYTFAYNVPSATQRSLIRNCATSPEKYFDPPSNAALVRSFQQIADELRKLHLSR